MTLRTSFRRYLLPLAVSCSILLLFSEVFIYYVVLVQCSWPKSDVDPPASRVKAMILADTHLLGFYHGHWFDKLRREWQMYRAFQTSITLYRPEVVFILGDIFDEGLWASEQQFSAYVQRFHSLFSVPEGTKLHVVVGNHDIGFHYWITPTLKRQFEKTFNVSSVDMVSLKGNIFVLINSMAMEGDRCSLCTDATIKLNKLSEMLQCSKSKQTESSSYERPSCRTRPILLQHFPLYRPSDANCNEPDAAPSEEKNISFREKWDCLSKPATDWVLEVLNPRVVFSGHTHHGCYVEHTEEHIPEWTVPSFSWRNKNNPTFLLATFTPTTHSVSKCYMPRESTVIAVYGTGAFLVSSWIYLRRRRRC